VQAEEGAACWRWTGTHDAYGYANFKVQDVDYKVHRVSYELCVGPIPEGLTLDHLCRVRDCVNPLHLEAHKEIERLKVRVCSLHCSDDAKSEDHERGCPFYIGTYA